MHVLNSSLQSSPNYYMTSAVDTVNMFLYSQSLSWCDISFKTSVSFQGCIKLEAPALVHIFNNLQVVTGETNNITGCYGAPLLTPIERAIATGKGWTIIG